MDAQNCETGVFRGAVCVFDVCGARVPVSTDVCGGRVAHTVFRGAEKRRLRGDSARNYAGRL